MNVRRSLSIALLMALILSTLVFLSASAAPAAQTGRKINPTYTTLRLKGKTRFSPTPRAPANDSRAIDLNRRANRPIPKARNLPSAATVPIVAPLPIDNLSTAHTGKGLNAFDMRSASGFNVTPPDQGLCVSGKYAVEAVNDVMTVYDTSLGRLAGDMGLNPFFGYAPSDFNVGDPKCYYDPAVKRFFLTVYDVAAASGSGVDLAVSMTDNPLLGWYLYQFDTSDSKVPPCPCFGDQPLLGADRYALFISTNQYPNAGGFAGADLYVFDKYALSLGSVVVNEAILNLGLDIPTPDGTCVASGGLFCWYSTQPAISPTPAAWDSRQGGIEYMLSALQFTGEADNRIALWAITNTQSMMGTVPGLGLQLATLNSENYAFPPDAVQKNDGILDAGQFYYGWNPANGAGPIATNDDRMNQTEYVGGLIWGGLNTAVDQGRNLERHAAVAYFGVRPKWDLQNNLGGKIPRQGYVSPAHADAMFPSIGITPLGRGIINYSISGAKYYPTTAYSNLGAAYGPTSVHIAAGGRGSLDDFCEYPLANCAQTQVPSARPRFGDYSAAVVVGGLVYFANEYVQYPECALSVFNVNRTCSDTRGTRTNWGTSLSRLVP